MKILNLLKECFTDCFSETRSRKHSDHDDFMKLMQWGSYSEVASDYKKKSLV